MLGLYFFGPTRLELDGTPVHIPRRKVMALLAYLAVTGQSHSRDTLATLLWPKNDQSSARAELRRTLSVLKRTLGEGWLCADFETARLNTRNDLTTGKSFWLDVDDFQGKLKVCEAHNHPPNVTCPDCLLSLEQAVELYSDDFMAGFSLKDCPTYDEWQFFRAEELRGQLASALERLSSHYSTVGEYEATIRHARRWLALDPLQEAAHRQLISLFSQSGQRAAALRQYEICRQTLADELRVDPSEETKELYQGIQSSTLVTTATLHPKSNLPVQSTPFIGREVELAEIRTKVQENDCRLLTLLGPGGSGKTRLAIEAAGAFLDKYKHGVFFVNLTPLQEADKISSTIAGSLSYSFYKEGTPEEQLLDYLGNKEMLLILDNFEHLLAGIGFVYQILNAAPGIKILATSRTSLAVTGEHLYPVMGMSYPKALEPVMSTASQYSAIKLFESEASRRQPTFELTDENIPDVTRICALVEGMPLGIVLAASWVMLLTPGEIAEEIVQDIAFLETELQDLPQRQRGVRSVFNHSWRLLSEGERKIMCALSVFRGGFTREAVQKVARVSLGDLMRLTQQSLLHRTSSGRYEIHELLRQYAAEKLESDLAAADHIGSKHSDYYCQTLAVWERDLQGPKQNEAEMEIRGEIDNIRAAWVWAVEKTRVKSLLGAINGLCLFYYRIYHRLEGEAKCRALTQKLAATSDTEQLKVDSPKNESIDPMLRQKLEARTLSWGSLFNMRLGNKDYAGKLAQESLNFLKKNKISERDTRFEKAMSLSSLSYAILWESPKEANSLAEEALRLFRDLNEPWWVGMTLGLLGMIVATKREKIKIFEKRLEVQRKHDDLWGMADSLWRLATQFGLLWQFKEAEFLNLEALEIYQKLNDRHRIATLLGSRGAILVWQGRFIEARELSCEIRVTDKSLGYIQSLAAMIHAQAGFPDQFLGEYEAARSQAQYAIVLSREVKHYWTTSWAAWAIDILGRTALAESSYSEAKGWFQECLSNYREVRNPENSGQALACLGFTARGLNQIPQAHGYFCEALHVAIKAESYLSLFHTLPGIALLFADRGEAERAVELYALAATQGIVANSKWFDDIAGDEIARAAEGLPFEVAKAAKVRGRGLDLWETAEGLLAELEKMGWDVFGEM